MLVNLSLQMVQLLTANFLLVKNIGKNSTCISIVKLMICNTRITSVFSIYNCILQVISVITKSQMYLYKKSQLCDSQITSELNK